MSGFRDNPGFPTPFKFDAVYNLLTGDVISLFEYNQLHGHLRRALFGEYYQYAKIVYAEKEEDQC